MAAQSHQDDDEQAPVSCPSGIAVSSLTVGAGVGWEWNTTPILERLFSLHRIDAVPRNVVTVTVVPYEHRHPHHTASGTIRTGL
jgi:hypothetical protein